MEKKMRHVASTIETLAAAFGSGVLTGRYGSMEVFGVPATALGGIALWGASFMGFLGKMDEDGIALGTGLLANYSTILGAGVGDKLAVNAGKGGMWPGPVPTSHTDKAKAAVKGTSMGSLPSAQAPLTQAELEAMASAVR